MSEHEVAPGETLASIAARYGFAKADTVWQMPENQKLRDARKNPHVLLAGDVLVIPEKQKKTAKIGTGSNHKFVVEIPKLTLRARLLDVAGDPIASAPYEAKVEGRKVKGSTDAEGALELTIRPTDRRIEIVVAKTTYVLGVGDLDPEIARTGVAARLQNLGYLPSMREYDDAMLLFALQLFADEQRLELTSLSYEGVCAKLEEVHGS